MSVPNRKQRNQPSNRIHDIEFATEISTSLLSQVRNLQALLAEKEETLRTVTLEKSRLEVEAEGFSQRLRTLDESEHRYKDENWNLETQIHEHIAAAKEAADREKKLTHSLSLLQAEKSTAQKELDEIKLSHAKLSDDHVSALKHHDIELGTVRRNVAVAENDRSVLLRKVDELNGQNQELAKAVALQRGRMEDREQAKGLSDEDFDTANDNLTPDEGSPPPSPMKAGTPRHSMLESETLKSSLHHAHRMIQNLKGNIHREKTEKLELKRMLQDARDELEARRGEGSMGSGNPRRSRKVDSKEFKKALKPGQLGGPRNSRNEVFLDETNWEEDIGQQSPTHAVAHIAAAAVTGSAASKVHDSTDNSDAFETANERATETEAFQTGAEEMSSDDLTETETAVPNTGRTKPARLSLGKAGNRQSFQSTASSGDEYVYEEAKTPTATQPQRMRLRVGRGNNRRSRLPSEEPQFQSSPVSFANSSRNGTPKEPSQSLFAELGELGGSDDESILVDTPSRTTFGSPPANYSIPPVPKLPMVDSGTMTEPWELQLRTPQTAIPLFAGAGLAGAALGSVMHSDDHRNSAGSQTISGTSEPSAQGHEKPNLLHVESPVLGNARPVSATSDVSSQYDPEIMEEKLAKFPSPPSTRSHTPMNALNDLESNAAPLTMSSIVSKDVAPVSPNSPATPKQSQGWTHKKHPSPDPMVFSSIQAVDIEPLSPRSPRRDGVIIPRNEVPSQSHEVDDPFIKQEQSATPKPSFLGSVFGGWNKKSPATPIIAEDDTRQSPSQSPLNETPESQRPFKELSTNVNERILRKPRVATVDESSQTALTAQQIEDMLNSKKREMIMAEDSQKPGLSTATRAAAPAGLKLRKSSESIGSVGRARSAMSNPDYSNDTITFKKPTSPGSVRSNSISSTHPPLPTDHRQVIAAAAQRVTSSNGGQSSINQATVQNIMGPPIMPASAYRTNPNFRPRTPSQQMSSANSMRGGTTPRPHHSSAGAGVAEITSPTRSRRSSVSSFTSEINNRFNINANVPLPHGIEPGTDPRMIHAITQTMIGEYLWKYTRKAGRGAMSENRHRRYFWIHPYTRTLYWSDRDPSTAGRAELKAKSVAIEAVRVVTDDNPMPPGLHRKSLVIMTPGRAVKFTATTGQRHETWFNALSYLLLRTNEDNIGDTAEVAGALTSEDVNEFMGYGNPARRGPASLSSYNSRTTRNESPAPKSSRFSIGQPSATHQHASTSSRASMGTLSRLSNYWKPGRESQMGKYSSRKSRRSVSGAGSIYEASEVHDSAEDLREVIEKQDRESDKLENVRACCDGKTC